jgi:hypothetical protein
MKNTMSDANYYLNNKLDQFKVAGDVLDLKSEIREINSFLSDLPKMTFIRYQLQELKLSNEITLVKLASIVKNAVEVTEQN